MMAKGKQQIRIIENKVYCKIIFLLGIRESYPLELWRENALLKKAGSIQNLSREMNFLAEESFLICRRQLDKNKKYYRVNLSKIIDVFLDYVQEVNYRKEITKQFRTNSKKNRLVRFIFADFFEYLRQSCINMDYFSNTLKDLFDTLMSSISIEDKIKFCFIDLLMENTSGGDPRFAMARQDLNKKGQKKLIYKIWKDLIADKEEFAFFEHFLVLTRNKTVISDYFFDQMPAIISNKLSSGFLPDEEPFYRLRKD